MRKAIKDPKKIRVHLPEGLHVVFVGPTYYFGREIRGPIVESADGPFDLSAAYRVSKKSNKKQPRKQPRSKLP